MQLIQINLQQHMGGGELYTVATAHAAAELGLAAKLVCHADAPFWGSLLNSSIERVAVRDAGEIPALLGDQAAWVLNQAPFPEEVARQLAPRHLLTSMAHMPMYQRSARPFLPYRMVFPVSGYVRAGLQAANIPVWREALYGIPDLRPRSAALRPVERESEYDWDRRKFRDRLFGFFEPLQLALRPRQPYVRRPGLVLGVVSRLTPIKQFPQLFAALAPVLARHPEVQLDIFGSGGYASVRDLRRALAPVAAQVRFWGQQSDVRSLYESIDYLVAGLPEKEALGLNVLEAQAAGTKVLAMAAPPFSETIVDGVTGYLYADPRLDQGRDFERVLLGLRGDGQDRVDEARARAHLDNFSFAAFTRRLGGVAEWARNELETA